MERPDIETIQHQLDAIDPTPWRAEYDTVGDLILWFHASLAEDPRRIIISACMGPDDLPSKNELAACAFLLLCREHMRDLIAYIAQLEAYGTARPGDV